MSEVTLSPTRKRLSIFLDNPVTIKELRSRMRGRRAFIVLTTYLTLMSGFIMLVYLSYASASGTPYGPDVREAGKFVFGTVLFVEIFLVVFIAPAFTAGAISGEKERQTYDLLQTTLLKPSWFVLGKLSSALSYVFLLIVASIPLQSIAFLLGGLSLEELIVAQLLVVVTAVAFSLFGLYASAVTRSTISASVLTFGVAIFWTIGLPIIAGFFAGFVTSVFYMTSSGLDEMILAYVGMTAAALNLPATLVASEAILLEENALFFFKSTFSGGYTAWLFSPWPLYILFHLLIAFVFYRLCVRKVSQIANK